MSKANEEVSGGRSTSAAFRTLPRGSRILEPHNNAGDIRIMLTYPIHESYVSHWGYWHAAREILQNAMDSGEFTVDYIDQRMVVSNMGQIDDRNLLLGLSEKGADDRGKYGEGLKLAMIVCAREGREMRVHTGSGKCWTPQIIESQEFGGERVLAVSMSDSEESAAIVSVGMDQGEWDVVRDRFLSDATPRVLDDKPGHVYVGGLWVCHMDDIDHGYNFDAATVSLNRDRDFPSILDVQWHAAELLDDNALLDSAMGGGREIDRFSAARDGTAQRLASAWTSRFPDSVPVGTGEQDHVVAERARFVPDWLAKAIRSVKSFALSFRKSPIDRLRDWGNGIYMTDIQRQEFDEIVKSLAAGSNRPLDNPQP